MLNAEVIARNGAEGYTLLFAAEVHRRFNQSFKYSRCSRGSQDTKNLDVVLATGFASS